MEVGQYDVGVKLENYFSPKQNIALSKNGSNEINFSMRDRLALPIAIGEAYGGVIVFDLTEDGHGLVVAVDDLGEFTWQEAKRQCKSYAGGGFADWYLPSKKELKNLNKVFNRVNSSIAEEGGKKIQLRYYWSRTGDWSINGNGHLNAWGCVFGRGNGCGIHRKTNSYYVRPVRAF
jgi:hypothetical protein